MARPSLFVLYGSQTGNAESIAKELSDMLLEKGIDNTLATLNHFKTAGHPTDSPCILVIVCATTGNGDCPENADAWWRSIKLRSVEKTKFANCKYVILGLGDSNYDKFCFMGKQLDKRLGELGGERFAPAQYADEATNLEETVERWKESTLTFLEQQYC